MDTVTVVIPSLGASNLLQTISFLNAGSLVPDEILICVPDNTILEFDIPNNAKLIHCNKRSQVAQRAKGFKLATSEFILQLDDDTHLSTICLENLVDAAVNLPLNCAVSATLMNAQTKSSFYQYENIPTFFNIVRHFISNGLKGYVPGTVTSVGSCFGPEFSEVADSVINIEWLAGCCVLHRRDNLIHDDYYPYRGKAYAEDLIASYLYKQKNITFYNSPKALVYTQAAEPNEGSLLELLKELRARRYYITLSGLSTLHFYLYATFRCGYEMSINIPKRLVNRIRVGNAK